MTHSLETLLRLQESNYKQETRLLTSLTTMTFLKKTLADFEGKIKILSVIPSIDTGICSLQTRRFVKNWLADNFVV